jgi:hypothetical protein
MGVNAGEGFKDSSGGGVIGIFSDFVPFVLTVFIS